MLLSLVVPVFNEQEGLGALMARLGPVLQSMECDFELIFVNDGSTDDTALILNNLTAADPRIKCLAFSRNFGHQAAITAGLDFAEGDAAVVMDSDLQDPPELLPEMWSLIQAGYDVVSAQRRARPGDNFFKQFTASAFYWFMRRFVDCRIASEVGDFRMFSRSAVLAVRQFREQHRFMRGLVAWLGLKEVMIPFQRDERLHGVTKYPLVKMLQFAWTAVSSFSALPLKLSTNLGLVVTLFGVGYFLYSLSAALITKTALPGWTSLACLQVIFSGAILTAVGTLGSYVARIYEEAKGRPLYVVGECRNLPVPAQTPARAVLLAGRPGVSTATAVEVSVGSQV